MNESSIIKKYFYCPKEVKLIKGKALSINNHVITYTDLPSLGFLISYYRAHQEEKIKKTFHKNFNTSGIMLDCSRNGVVKVDVVKDFIIKSAQLGFNRFYLYIENTYQIKGEPYFGYLRGAYSFDELKAIGDFAKSLGIEIIPCIQTLSHLKTLLRHKAYEKIRDGISTLLIGEKATYQLIEKMIKTMVDALHPSIIHIGMDEAFEFGRNQYLDKHGVVDRIKLFNEHLNKVIKIADKYHVKTYIWGDMYFRIIFNNEYKYGHCLPDHIVKSIPKNVSLVYWDYYQNLEKEYTQTIKTYQLTKRPVVFAGGSWRWCGFAPAINESLKKSDSALKACIKNNVKDVFITAWGDNGNECSFYSILPVMCQYALFNYCSLANNDHIDKLLKIITGDSLSLFLNLDLPNHEDKKIHTSAHNPSKYLFYQDPLCGIFDPHVKLNFASTYLKHAKVLQMSAKKSSHYAYIYQNLSNLCQFLSIKSTLGIRLRNAYKNNNKKELKKIAQVDIPTALSYLSIFHASLRKQWMKENKPYGFDVLDGRIGYLTNRLKDTQLTVNDYLNHKIKQIEILEEKLLPYDNQSIDDDICWNSWVDNVTLHNL